MTFPPQVIVDTQKAVGKFRQNIKTARPIWEKRRKSPGMWQSSVVRKGHCGLEGRSLWAAVMTVRTLLMLIMLYHGPGL